MGIGAIWDMTSTEPEGCMDWSGVRGKTEHHGSWTTVAGPKPT